MYNKHMQSMSSVESTLLKIIEKTPVQEGDQPYYWQVDHIWVLYLEDEVKDGGPPYCPL
jgi:hypothetical protein